MADTYSMLIDQLTQAHRTNAQERQRQLEPEPRPPEALQLEWLKLPTREHANAKREWLQEQGWYPGRP